MRKLVSGPPLTTRTYDRPGSPPSVRRISKCSATGDRGWPTERLGCGLSRRRRVARNVCFWDSCSADVRLDGSELEIQTETLVRQEAGEIQPAKVRPR